MKKPIIPILMTALFLIMPSAAGALDTDFGGFLDLRHGFLFGNLQTSAQDAFTHGNAVSASPLLSPAGGGGGFAEIYFTPHFGAGAFLSVEFHQGAVSVTDSQGRTIGGFSLDEIAIDAGIRALQKIGFLNGHLFLSEGLTVGLVPASVNITYRSVNTVLRSAEYPDLGSRLLFGGELRTGFSRPLGPGTAFAGFRFDVLSLPTGLPDDSGHTLILSLGIEIGYSIRIEL